MKKNQTFNSKLKVPSVIIQDIEYRVGDKVKLLKKSSYSGERVFDGIISNFAIFGKTPYIEVLYSEYREIKIAHFSEDSTDLNITKFANDLSPEVGLFVDTETYFKKEIEKAEQALFELKDRKAKYLAFLTKYNADLGCISNG